MDFDLLFRRAKEARENSYSPYSKFPVGAAVQTVDGQIFTGCNVENASYGLTICAEMVAICKAVSEGNKKISAIAIVADTEDVCRPCGACRQIILEFGDKITVAMGSLKGEQDIKNIKELIPYNFSSRDLK